MRTKLLKHTQIKVKFRISLAAWLFKWKKPKWERALIWFDFKRATPSRNNEFNYSTRKFALVKHASKHFYTYKETGSQKNHTHTHIVTNTNARIIITTGADTQQKQKNRRNNRVSHSQQLVFSWYAWLAVYCGIYIQMCVCLSLACNTYYGSRKLFDITNILLFAIIICSLVAFTLSPCLCAIRFQANNFEAKVNCHDCKCFTSL